MKKRQNAQGMAWAKLEYGNMGFLFLLTLLWAIFHRHVLFDGQAVVLDDAARDFFPQWLQEEKVWKSGLIPLWNQDAAFGSPNLANISNASWYLPLRLFYRWLDPVTAFDAMVLSHHLLSLIGFFCFLKGRRLSGASAFLGSLFFGFSIHAIVTPFVPTLIAAFSWIPWIYWAGDRLFSGARGSLLILAAVLSLQLASGYPLLTYLTLLTLFAEKISDPISRKREHFKSWLGIFTATALALGFNMVWIPSFVEFLGFGNTTQRLNMPESMPFKTLLTWFNPFFLFHPLHGTGPLLYEFSAFFMGLPAVGLVIWSLVSGKVDRRPFLLALLWIALSLGGVPAQVLSFVLPFYHWVVRSGYWMGLVVFAFAYLAALAAERRVEKTVGRETIDWKWLVVGLAVYGSALLLGVPMGLGSFWVSLIFFAVLGLGAVPSKAVRWTLLALATLFSVWPADQGVHFTMDRKYYEEEPPLARQMVEPGRVYASFPEVIRFETVSGKSVGESYYRLKNAMVSNWPLAFGKEECYFYGSFFLSDYFKWCFSSTQFSNIISRKVLDYLNVRYVLGPHHFTNFRWLSTEKEPTPLSENLSPMPKWFSVSGAIPESSFDRDLWKVGNPGFHFSRQCFVENEDVCGPYSRRVVREIKRNSNGLTLEAHGTGKALLVSSEMAYPGWIATVEGRGVPLLKVNHGFRGVVLTDGEETVKMTFCPTPFRLGCFLSLLACALWAGMLFYQAGLRWRI